MRSHLRQQYEVSNVSLRRDRNGRLLANTTATATHPGKMVDNPFVAHHHRQALCASTNKTHHQQYDLPPPPPRRRVARTRSVQFALDKEEYITIPGLSGMEEEQRSAVWYSQSEYQEMKEEIEDTLKLLKAGLSDPERVGLCFRGIESKALRRKKIQIIASSVHAVLSTWKALEGGEAGPPPLCRFSEDDENVEDITARIYKGYTIQSVVEAQRMGQWDEKCIQLFVREDKSPMMPRRKWAKAG